MAIWLSTIEHAWDLLTAPGVTSSLNVRGCNSHNIQYTVAAINTSVDVRVEGTIDGTNWVNVDTADTTILANGSYLFAFLGKFRLIRFNFVSEAGGTDATVNVAYIGGS